MAPSLVPVVATVVARPATSGLHASLHGLLTGFPVDGPTVAVDAALAALAGLYLAGVRRLRRRARPWSPQTTAFFVAGLALVFVALGSGVARYDDVSFPVHMTQHVLLMMAAPPLLVLGRPVRLLAQASARPVQLSVVHVANGRIARYAEAPLELGFTFPATLSALGGVELVVVSTKAQSRRWRELVASYHYLGYTPFAGAQLRYLVECPLGTLGALGFAASAWKCAPRDALIGWDEETRKARLHLVVGNARFLILPQVRVQNLASVILARAARRLPADWQAAYGYEPVLLETFVESDRFSGASYRAANWIRVGQTKGRGKLDRYHEHVLPVKDVYLYPLHRDYRAILSAP